MAWLVERGGLPVGGGAAAARDEEGGGGDPGESDPGAQPAGLPGAGAFRGLGRRGGHHTRVYFTAPCRPPTGGATVTVGASMIAKSGSAPLLGHP